MKTFKLGIFILSLLFISQINIVNAKTTNSSEEVLKALITDNDSIDHELALDMVKECDLHLCQAYYAYFLLKSDTSLSKRTIKQIEDIVQKLDKQLYSTSRPWYERYENTDALKRRVLYILSSNKVFEELSKKVQKDIEAEYAFVPLWLVVEEPQILENLADRWSLGIKAKDSIRELPSVKVFLNHLDHMERGRWITTSYNTHRGSIRIDLSYSSHNFEDMLSYGPAAIKMTTSMEDALLPLQSWSYQGLWNKKLYEDFQQEFHNAVREVKEYYQTKPYLKDYSQDVEKLLAAYIYSRFPKQTECSYSKAYEVFSNGKHSLAQLKANTKNFKQEDWDIALSMAILNKEPKETVAWLLKSGANPNAVLEHETALMKAVTQPLTLEVLLKSGAEPNVETPYGKTALFYAIQWNNFDSVKLLVEHGADVNKKLHDIKAFKKINDEIVDYDFYLEDVANFTPLIYSLRYGSEEMSEYLCEHKATLGDNALDKFEEWATSYGHDDVSALHVRIRNLKLTVK